MVHIDPWLLITLLFMAWSVGMICFAVLSVESADKRKKDLDQAYQRGLDDGHEMMIERFR